jgi:hypothetical protein
MKIAARQRECAALERKSASPGLTPEERRTIGRLQEQSIEEYHNLQHMLGLYERQPASRRCIFSLKKLYVLRTALSDRSGSVLPGTSGYPRGRYEGGRSMSE